MTVTGEYEPSPTEWVRDQVAEILRTGTTESVDIQERRVVMMSMIGASSGKLRRVPVMRVEQEGVYAAVASKGGAPEDPAWYANLKENPKTDLQDGAKIWGVTAREIEGEEREKWWPRCVAAFPPYAEYAQKTDRLIPVFLFDTRGVEPITAEPRGAEPTAN